MPEHVPELPDSLQGSAVTWLFGHTSSMYGRRAGVSPIETWGKRGSPPLHRVDQFFCSSTIYLDSLLDKVAVSRRITTFKTATAKHPTRIIEMMLKNTKDNQHL